MRWERACAPSTSLVLGDVHNFGSAEQTAPLLVEVILGVENENRRLIEGGPICPFHAHRAHDAELETEKALE